MSKLTLSVSQEVIENAKAYAAEEGKSLSAIIEEYLKALTNRKPSSDYKSKHKIVKELRGFVKIPIRIENDSEILTGALIDKYIKE
ncbi:MAG: hypothetical protein KDC49_11225 [Saprospiraceae bacterium]|nr:hypothetical protein [Saprospiraceae bacterium]